MKEEEIKNIFNNLMKIPSENEVIEWKAAKNNFDFNELGKYFSALSNEANLKNKKSSWLIFGVSNKKEILGTNYRNDRSSLDLLKNEISKQTTSNLSFIEIYEIVEGEERVVMFEIPPAPKSIPVGWKGHFYAREGESLCPLSLEKIDRIRKEHALEDWSAAICKDASIEDLSTEAIAKARELYIRKNLDKAEEIKSWTDEIFLNKAKVTIKSKITNTAILLLGKPESEHFINPSISKISWILKDKDNSERDYKHFTCPLIVSVGELYSRIRNLKYRYIKDDNLFPEEVDRYDTLTIREALNNCIAHQDYTLCGKINVIENEDDSLIFSNSGSFIPETIDSVISNDSPSEYYRNRFLADAMVNLNMIDTIGSGIKKMFISQKKKFFPMPDYDFSNNKVKLTILGKVLDMNYARKVAQIPDLDLRTIILLDKVQKRKQISKDENKFLRRKNLIEGRGSKIFISSYIASKINNQAEYMRAKGVEDEYAQKMIVDLLEKFKTSDRKGIEKVILDKLPDILDASQKKDKVRNLLQKLKRLGKIKVSEEHIWSLVSFKQDI